MNALIVYGSQYGTTKRYAEQLSEMINLPVKVMKILKS